MNEKIMKRRSKDPLMRAEYDFSGGVRGKYYQRYVESSNVVVLEPDVHRRFKNSSAVNKALRSFIRAKGTQRGLPKRPDRTPAKTGGGRKCPALDRIASPRPWRDPLWPPGRRG